MSIAIITNTSENIRGLTEVTLPHKRGYADRHGYKLACYEFDYQRYNEVVVDSLRFILNAIKANDVVMTCGADVMFTNWNIRIEDVLLDGDHIVMARERTRWWPINDDVMIWKNTPTTVAYYERLIEDFEIWKKYPWRLQAHIWNLMVEEPEWSSCIRLVEPEVMNAHPSRWQLGNWVMHIFDMSIEEKIKQATTIAEHWPTGNPIWKLESNDVRPGVI